SSKSGLSTFNREFVINLAEITTGSMKIYCYVSKSDDRDREDAKKHGVNLINAEAVPGSRDPLDWLKVPPPELQHPHVIISHGRKLGTPACHIVRAAKCKWIQFVHVFCEDLGKYKKTPPAIIDTIEENEEKQKMEIELCKAADAVVAVGSRLQQKYSRSLLNVKVEIITPGIFGMFSNESKLAVDRAVVKHFNVSMFGRATFEDLSLKGYDIVANAIGPLGRNFELTFVGSSPGEHRQVEQWFLDNTGVSRNQLTIRGYCSDPEELKLMFYQSDLVALPPRTEGFGLVALEAISAGIPILVSGESGIAEALRKVEGGNTVIVELDEDADEWARRIREVSEEGAEEREAKARRLRDNYRKVYSWRAECERFKGMIEKVAKNANAVDKLDITIDVEDQKPAESNNQTTASIVESEKYQMDELQKSSAAPEMQGSVSHPKSLQVLGEKFFLSAWKNYLKTTPLQSKEKRDEFMGFMQDLLGGTSSPSVIFTTDPEKEREETPKVVKRQKREESLWNNKVMVSRSKISKEGGIQMVQNVPSCLIIPSKALPTPTEVTCSIWHPHILSPPLGRNEALVSSVLELACGSLSGTKKSYKFNGKVKLALSHSASDIKGYELGSKTAHPQTIL
ncbi:D-inositol 3-phosphate glycosyltransferase, partial [Stylophora pistillata]